MNGLTLRPRMMGFLILFLLGLMFCHVPMVGAAAAGNVNGDSEINLSDAIISLRICAKLPPGSPVVTGADVNGDGEIGMEEAIYVLQTISALRPPSGPLRVSAPNGGEALTAGSTYTITWQGSPDIQTVDILLSVDSGATYPYTLVSGTPNDGAYIWEPVPFHSPLKLSAACRIRIRDSANPATVSDESDGQFALVAAGAPMLLETLYAINQRLKNAPGHLEKDTDGDGLYDNVELYLGTDPKHKDSDKDGYWDYYEVFPDDVLDVPVPDQDGDGKIAAVDNDDNGDGKNDGRAKDSDGDHIPDYLELYGFVYRSGTTDLYYPWDGDITIRYYKTDPNQRSTDADHYDDDTEITGTNMDVSVMSPGKSPMIPAFPNIVVRMIGYTVTLNSEITETNGTAHEYGNTWEASVEQSSSTTKETHWELSEKVSASLTDFGVEVGYSYGESESETRTKGTSRSSGGQMSNATQWSRATCTNPTEAALVKFTFEVRNVGTCMAKDVRITQNLQIGDRSVATLTYPEAPDTIPWLAPNEADMTWIHERMLTLEELRALQTGVPVTTEVTAVSAKVVRKDGSNYVDVNEWGLYYNAAKAVSARLFMDLGRGNTTEQFVYAGTADGVQTVTLRDALIWAANGQDSPAGPKIRFYRPDGTLGDLRPLEGWYFSLDRATHDRIAGYVQQDSAFNFFDTVIQPGSIIVAKAPPVDPTPMLHWVELSPRAGTVKAYVDDYFFSDPTRLAVKFLDKYGVEHPMVWVPAQGYYACDCPLNNDGTPYFKDGSEKIVASNPMYGNANDPRNSQYQTQWLLFEVSAEFEVSYVPSFERPQSPVSLFEAPIHLVRDVAVSGNYAYLANGENGLLVVDVNPASPQYLTTVGSCMVPMIASVNRVFVSGGYAYMTDDYGGFHVVNVTDPAHPAIVGSCSVGGFFSAKGIFVSGSRAYVANGSNGLVIVDVSNPQVPAVAGSYDTPGQAYGVFASGGYAYVADGASGLVIVNVTDPAHPDQAGAYDTAGDARGVSVSGGYAYVTDGASGLQIVNVADPLHPTLVGSYDTPGQAYGVFVSGNFAYVADSPGLLVVDVTNPGNPLLAGSSGTIFNAERLVVSGDHAYLAGGEFGSNKFQIIALNPENPDYLRTGTCNTPGAANSLTVSGSHAYVADGASGLQIISVADPLHPTLVGSYDTPGQASGVFVSGHYAYVADEASGLRIVNVVNPLQPTLAGACTTPGAAYSVTVAGDYAYVADSAGLRIINVFDPSNPTIVGSYDTPGQPYGVSVSGAYAYVPYVTSGSGGLVVVNVADPAHPALAGSWETTEQPNGVFVSGRYAYVPAGSSGLLVVDVNDPAHPALAGSCDTPGYAMDVFVTGSYAHVADASGGLQVIDVSDPAHPAIAGSYSAGLYTTGVFVSGDYAYLIDNQGGRGALRLIGFK